MTPAEIFKLIASVFTLGLLPWLEERKKAKAKEVRDKAEAAEPKAVQMQHAAKAAIEHAKVPPRLLLAVEDNPTDIELLEYLLKRSGVHYEIARDAAEGWVLFAQSRHQIVLVDMRLPGMRGWRFAEQVRRFDPEVLVVCMVTMVEDLKHLHTGQFFGLIRKPVTLEGIQQILAKIK